MKKLEHKAFPLALRLSKLHKQLFMSGPAGSGKTTIAEHIARDLKLEYGFLGCTSGMSESHLLGRMNAQGAYIATNFIRLFENGGVFLLDEIDAADANTMMCINAALSNGVVAVPNRVEAPYAKRHKNFILLCAANTWGSGNNMKYVGRNALDASFIDRFAAKKIFVDYDKDLEKSILGDFPKIAVKLWNMRRNLNTNRLQRVISTRAFQDAAVQFADNFTEVEFFDNLLFGWSSQEVTKVIDGVQIEMPEINVDRKKEQVMIDAKVIPLQEAQKMIDDAKDSELMGELQKKMHEQLKKAIEEAVKKHPPKDLGRDYEDMMAGIQRSPSPYPRSWKDPAAWADYPGGYPGAYPSPNDPGAIPMSGQSSVHLFKREFHKRVERLFENSTANGVMRVLDELMDNEGNIRMHNNRP